MIVGRRGRPTRPPPPAPRSLVALIAAGARLLGKVLEAGAAPLLVQLVASPSSNAALKEQCAWALGNIAGDSAESRAHLEALHAVQALASQVGGWGAQGGGMGGRGRGGARVECDCEPPVPDGA